MTSGMSGYLDQAQVVCNKLLEEDPSFASAITITLLDNRCTLFPRIQTFLIHYNDVAGCTQSANNSIVLLLRYYVSRFSMSVKVIQDKTHILRKT